MKRKVWDITVKDNPNRVVMGENDEFYTTDTEAYLVFKLDDKNFNPATAVLTLENRNDGSLKNETVDVVDGLIEWEMPQRYIEHFGNWQGQLVYEDTKDGQPELYTSATFSFVVNAHIGDKKKPGLVEIENWEKFIREGTELIETWEDLEALREENERQRQENEQGRESAESERVANEEDRELNEAERISKDSERDSKIEAVEGLQADLISGAVDSAAVQQHVEERYGQLEEEYAPKLTEVTAQLAHKADRAEVYLKSQGINVNDFDEDTRRLLLEMEPGDINAVLGVGNVSEENIADGVVSRGKLADEYATGGRVFQAENLNTLQKEGNYLKDSGVEPVGLPPELIDKNVFVEVRSWRVGTLTVMRYIMQRLTDIGDINNQYVRIITPNSTPNFKKVETGLTESNYDDFIKRGANLLSDVGTVDGHYVDISTGDLMPSDRHKTTESVTVEPNAFYVVGNPNGWSGLRVVQFDGEDNFIKGESTGSEIGLTSFEFETHDDTREVRISAITGGDWGDRYDWTLGKIKIEEVGNGDTQQQQTEYDVFVFMGQSNMAGRGRQSETHPEVAPDASEVAYEYRAITDKTKLNPLVEPFGVDENYIYGINDGNSKTGGMVSSFALSYHGVTGRKMIGISASKGGTPIEEWLPDTALFNDAYNRIESFNSFSKSANLKIKNIFMVWQQGEGDVATSREVYEERLQAIIDGLKPLGVKKCLLIRLGNVNESTISAQTEIPKENKDVVLIGNKFVELGKSGYTWDGAHFYQSAYNIQGEQAGINASYYIETGKEPTMYDDHFDNLYYSYDH